VGSDQLRKDPLNHVTPERLESAVHVTSRETERSLRNVFPSMAHQASMKSVGTMYPVADCRVRLGVGGGTSEMADVGGSELTVRIAEPNPRVSGLQARMEPSL
jgi:hypothetical protein